MRIYNILKIMEAVEVVKVFSNAVNVPNDVVIVLHKAKLHTSIKAFTEHVWTVWYVKNNKRYSLCEIRHTAREVTEAEERNNIKVMEANLITNLFSIISDKELLKSLRNGEFTGWGINPN